MSKTSRLYEQIENYLDKAPKEGFDFLGDDGHLLNASYNEIKSLQKEINELRELLREVAGNTSCTYSIGSNATAVGTLEHSFNCFKCSFLSRPEVKAILEKDKV